MHHLSELKQHHVTQLVEMAVANGIEGANRMRKQDLIFAMLKNTAKKGESIFGPRLPLKFAVARETNELARLLIDGRVDDFERGEDVVAPAPAQIADAGP